MKIKDFNVDNEKIEIVSYVALATKATGVDVDDKKEDDE